MNTGNFSQPGDNEIEYQATVRASNASRNTNGQQVSVDFDVLASGIKQADYSFFLRVINQ